ncbi:hypothetical protein AB0C93_23865 [Streptomyces sp. NPDC048518]|uniref:hypothetical protein n=1 Tax=Streptomyces sp. NPDC048518 TaxID=3155029 RepID=UPI0033D70F7C
MVTSAHEASHRIFQDRPEILVPVFGTLGLPFPEKASVDVLTPDATELQPLERRVDSVLRIQPSDGEDFLLAIEAQGRRDPDKEASWPYYVAYLRAKFRLPVLLLVVCKSRATARWAAGPFDCGARGWTAQTTWPLVVGPDNVPVITERRAVEENLAMATFAALTHGNNPDAAPILEALARAVQASDKKSATYYNDLLDVGLGDTRAGAKWRELMTFVTYFPGRGTVRETAYLEGKAEGKAEGEATALLRVLAVRGIDVPEETRERIGACADLAVLNRWLERAVHAGTVDELFVEDSAESCGA